MGQQILPESIEEIQKGSSTTVTLAPSRVNIGGQQFVNDSELSLSTAGNGAGGLDTGSVAADTAYKVYAINNNGTMALIASLADSPSGFSASKFIGIFITDVTTAIDVVSPDTGGDIFYKEGPKVVGNVGDVGQIRAGKVLSLSTFTDLGISANNVALWNLSSNTNDSSGNGNDLTSAGIPFTNPGLFGESNKAASTDGVSTFMEVGPDGFVDVGTTTDDYAIGCWFAADTWSIGTTGMIFNLVPPGLGAEDRIFFIYRFDTDCIALQANAGVSEVRNVSGFTNGKYKHFVFVNESATGLNHVYIDGELAGSFIVGGQGSTPGSGIILRFGRRVDDTFPYAGKFREAFMIKGHLLSSDDVQKIYRFDREHSSNINPENQQWEGTLTTAAGKNRPLEDYVVDKQSNSLQWDLDNLDPTTQVTIKGRRN